MLHLNANGTTYPTMPASLVLIRHGESESNLAKSMHEKGEAFPREHELMRVHTSERRLTPLGVSQAKQAGQWLRDNWIDPRIPRELYRFFVSDYVRAMETAGHLGLGCTWQIDSRIVERNWGDLDQMTHASREGLFAQELEDRKDRAFFWRPTNGETFQDVFNRLNLMKERIRRSPASHVAIVCHGETMWVWRKLLERLTTHDLRDAMLGQSEQTRIHNCRIIEYSRYDADGVLQPRLVRYRMIDPSDPENPRTNLGWQETSRRLWSDEDLLGYVEGHECFMPVAAE